MPRQSIPHWGWQLNNRTLFRELNGSMHLLKVPPAIAFDAARYDDLRSGFDSIRVFDRESGETYACQAATFDRHRALCERGFGRQYFMALSRWSINDRVPQLAGRAQLLTVPHEQLQIAMAL